MLKTLSAISKYKNNWELKFQGPCLVGDRWPEAEFFYKCVDHPSGPYWVLIGNNFYFWMDDRYDLRKEERKEGR